MRLLFTIHQPQEATIPFNGSGTYAAPSSPGAFNPAITGQNATPAAWNTLLADISTALSTTITKDGQTTITQDIPFAANKITDLGNATALTDALNQQGAWFVIQSQTITAASFVDFTGIAASINNLMCVWEVQPGTDAVDISLRTYGADGVLDTGASDYYFLATTIDTGGTSGVSRATAAYAALGLTVDNGSHGVGGRLEAANIQAATNTKFTVQSSYLSSSGTLGISWAGSAVRLEADRITGIRLYPSAGVFTGRATLFGSV